MTSLKEVPAPTPLFTGEAEDERAVGLLTGRVGVDVSPDGEAAGRSASALVEDRGEGTGLGERGVEAVAVFGGVFDFVVGDGDFAGAGKGTSSCERLGGVVVVSVSAAQALTGASDMATTKVAPTSPAISRLMVTPSGLTGPSRSGGSPATFAPARSFVKRWERRSFLDGEVVRKPASRRVSAGLLAVPDQAATNRRSAPRPACARTFPPVADAITGQVARRCRSPLAADGTSRSTNGHCGGWSVYFGPGRS